jgi:phosphatidylserine decarboxylase
MATSGAPENRSSPHQTDGDETVRDEVAPTALRGWGRILLAVLYLLPKNGLSRLAGRFASLRLPGRLQRAEIRLFARLADVNVEEASDPIESYESLQRFFARALREGARPIAGDSMSLVAPCDGAWGAAGRIERGTLLQVKGRTYSVAELLGDVDLAEQYEAGCFATFYLSPRDYHRFHTPAAGRMTRVDYCPGSLWPVNAIGLQGIDRLFARNERICAYLEIDQGAAATTTPPPIALVAVGATMVGSVRLAFDDLRTNVSGARAERRDLGDRAPNFARGEQWGHFEFGSTIIMLTPPERFEINPQPIGRPLTLGEIIGRRI